MQDEDEIERLLLAYSPEFQAIVEASRKQIREGDVLTHEAFWAEVDAIRAVDRTGQAQEEETERRKRRKTKGQKVGGQKTEKELAAPVSDAPQAERKATPQGS